MTTVKLKVKTFKMRNRKGYAAICNGCVTEGSTKNIALERMAKAIKRVNRKRRK